MPLSVPTTFFPSTLEIMDRGLSTGAHHPDDGLRERNVAAQSDLNVNAEKSAVIDDNGKDKAGKTFGRTPDGTGMSTPRSLCQLDS